MKKALSLLVAVSFYFSFALTPLLAGETIVYDGSDTTMLKTVNGWANSLAPSGSEGFSFGSSKSSSLSDNSITVSSNVAGRVYGAINSISGDTDDVTGNSVTINSGTIGMGASGGEAKAGNAIGNSVIVNDGTVSNTLVGGYSDSGNAIGNSATINGGTVSDFVAVGYSNSGNATDNSVTITSGTLNSYVYVGRSGTGNATDNSLTINGGTLKNNIYSGFSNSGNSTDNSVTITSGTFSGYVYGGYSDTGNAIGNILTINGGALNANIHGGCSEISGDAANNIVTINSGTIYANVYGGFSDSGNATGNSIITYGGTVRNDLIGGKSSSGNATDNIVTINGGAFSNSVYGGYSNSGNATGNSVTITSGTVSLYVYGGRSDTGNAIGNILTINGGTLSDNVHGGCSDSSGDATDNIVTINGGALSKDVFGGYSDSGNTTDNILTINGGVFSENVFGGRSNSGNATGNRVTITSGTVSVYVYGGASATGNAIGNILTINGGTLKDNVHGGCSASSGDVTDNILTINGGAFSKDVFGGYAVIGNATGNSVTLNGGTIGGNIFGGNVCHSSSGSATFNTVTICSGYSYYDSVIYGGFVGTSTTTPAIGADARTGNTFNVMGINTVKGIQNFENYNFCLPDNVSNGSGILWVTDGDGSGNKVDITNSKISISGSGKVTLHENDIIYLIDTFGNGINAAGINTETTALFGISKFYDFTIEYVDDPYSSYLSATYTGKSHVNPQTKILSEGVAAGAILAGQGAENINGGLLFGLQEGKIEMFGSFFGGSSKYDTGSSVEMSVFGAAAGIGKKFGSFDAGAFIEYANGSFDTEYNGLKGDGEVSAIGAGILAKKDIKEDIYVEGLIRAGQVSNDYKSKIVDGMGILVNTDFDYSAIYFGISLGGGKIFKVSEKVNVDAFAKYALTNTGGGEATLSNDDKYEFDSILSNRIKAGAKGEYKINEKFTPYLALSYDYELSGDVDAKINGDKVESPTLNGGTFSGGLGLNTKVSEKLTLDLSANVYSGVREGVIGSLQVKYEF